MNRHILVVMKWLRDNSSVTKEELEINYDVAANTARCATYATYDNAANAVNAACQAAYGGAVDDKRVACAVDEYFERSGEDKQDYIDEIKKTSTVTTDNQSKIDDLLDLAFELLSRKEYEKIKESTNRVRKCLPFV